MGDKQELGRKFLELSAFGAYGTWVLLALFPLVLAGLASLIDESRSSGSLMLASIAIGCVSASYILRFYLVRNSQPLRARILEAGDREQVLGLVSGGFWWWLLTLMLAIAAVVIAANLV